MNNKDNNTLAALELLECAMNSRHESTFDLLAGAAARLDSSLDCSILKSIWLDKWLAITAMERMS